MLMVCAAEYASRDDPASHDAGGLFSGHGCDFKRQPVTVRSQNSNYLTADF
jgi:hypothetical protein